MKLLVVDDQSNVGQIISRVATQSGWDALHSVSADRLAERVRHDSVDVLMLDYAIDGNPLSPTNGMAVLRNLREQGCRVPAILFSGWSNRIDRTEAHGLGVVEVLEKPVCIQALRKSLRMAARAVELLAA